MKSVELQLNKRLLIVELPEGYSLVHFKNKQSKFGFVNLNNDVIDLKVDGKLDLTCIGSDLTEDIAKELVDTRKIGFSVDVCYNYNDNWYDYSITALESLISALEAKGYYWGKNPVEMPIKDDSECAKWQIKAFNKKQNEWKEAESRTFNPYKCFIFKIIK